MKIHIKGAKVLLYENGAFSAADKDVFIDGSVIASVGFAPEGFCADTVISGDGRLVMPGLINMHTHHYMSLFRNIANDTAFDAWLFDNMMPREQKLSKEDCYWGTMLSLCEQLRSGTTCFNDMYIIADAAAEAASDAGVRAFLGRCLNGDADDDKFEAAIEEAGRFEGEELLRFTLAPHAPYTCSEAYLRKIAEESEKRGMRIHYHLSESDGEMSMIREKYGMTPIQHAEKLGLLDRDILLAHCSKAQDEDMELLARPTVSVITNPVSNMKLGNGFAPLTEMIESGVNVCLGTDGPASNNALNMFRDMTITALIHKGVTEDPTAVSSQEALKCATVNGAAALGLSNVIGKIEAGYRADLIILDLNCPQLLPHNDIVSSLVYSAYGTEVETVIINGRIVMRDRVLLTIDEEKVKYEVRKRTGAYE